MNKYLKYILLLSVIFLAGYKSVYLKKLSTMKDPVNEKFDAVVFTKKLWVKKLPAKLEAAVELSTLMEMVKANPGEAFSKYSNALGIGNYRYSLVKTEGSVTAINPDDITLQIKSGDSALNVMLATEYIYGNAIRDASALVDIKDFTNNMDLNNISEEMNKKVRYEILPFFKRNVKKGDHVNVTGAIELNAAHIKFNGIEIIPVSLKITQ